MGSLFGGYLSQHNNVWLIDVNEEKISRINREGVTINELDGKHKTFYPTAVKSGTALEDIDLIIIFVKSMFSAKALSDNKLLIGSNTYVMSLQNGIGHEDTLLGFVPRERIIIGATQHNSSITEEKHIHHGGGGKTNIGLLNGNSESLQSVADSFIICGIDTIISDNVKKIIWNKLFLNVSASVLTAVLQVKLGFMLDNQFAGRLMKRLIFEAVGVANADGMNFDPDNVYTSVKEILENVREGYTSIYADIQNGISTEVDTINGSIVRIAKQYGISVPNHEFIVDLVHAWEGKKKQELML
jgi:2-dehydropantoate 2-reductase